MILDKLILSPHRVVHYRQYYRVLTSGFIHANWLHLFMNMITYYFFAFILEATYLGHLHFLILYIVGMLLSHVSTVIKYKNQPEYRSLGASGAVSAVVFSYIIFNPTATLLVFFIPMPAWLFALLYMAYSYFLSRKKYDNINHEAHMWGAAAGIVLTIILEKLSNLF